MSQRLTQKNLNINEFICFTNKEFYALPCLFYAYLELDKLGSLVIKFARFISTVRGLG